MSRVQAPAMTKRYALRRKLHYGRQVMKLQTHEQSTAGNAAAADSQAEEIRQLKEAVLRQRAEFDNFRKRTQRERDQIREMATETLIAKLLPVLDNMERALTSADNTSDVKSVRDGVIMIATQLRRALEAEGLQQVEALNQRFDPTIHDALAAEEHPGTADGHIFEVLLPGYTFKDKTLRAAMVKVAKSPDSEKTNTAE